MGKHIYLFVIIILFSLTPISFGERMREITFSVQRAEAYTYQDVENWLATNPAPEGCKHWVEEVTTEVGKGYKIWENCGSKIVKGIEFRYEGGINYNRWYYPPYSCYPCDGSGRWAPNHMDLLIDWKCPDTYGWPPYEFDPDTGGVEIRTEYYCDSSSKTMTLSHWGLHTLSTCIFPPHDYGWVNCHDYETLVAEFIPIDECEVSVTVSPSEVWPQGAGSSETTSTISVSLTKSAPPEGCTINFTVEVVENSGGHSSHTGSRPKGTVSPESIPFSSNEGWGPKYATYTSSEVSGEEKIKAELKRNIVSEAIITVKVPGLGAFPSSGDYHIVVRDGTDTHPQGTHGMGITIEILEEVAQKYFNKTGRKLSVNDLSLPDGGLFDINSNWATPHIEHRAGNDSDINRTDGGGVFTNCEDDIQLRKAVEKVGKYGIPRLKCESGGRKHIDFD